jgi:hypothetical protein
MRGVSSCDNYKCLHDNVTLICLLLIFITNKASKLKNDFKSFNKE